MKRLTERSRHAGWFAHSHHPLRDRLRDGLDVDRLKILLIHRAQGACPLMQKIGTKSAIAEYNPVIISVPAGPDVPIQTPMLPAMAGVWPSAM